MRIEIVGLIVLRANIKQEKRLADHWHVATMGNLAQPVSILANLDAVIFTSSFTNSIKTEMARLLAKHPKGFEGFEENMINQRNEGAFVANRNLKIGSVDAGNAAPTESQGILKDAPVGLSN